MEILYSKIAGVFVYSEETEEKEKFLFEALKGLELAQEEMSSKYLLRIMKHKILAHPYDLHGRRRMHSLAETLKVESL